jgi:restriction system protein
MDESATNASNQRPSSNYQANNHKSSSKRKPQKSKAKDWLLFFTCFLFGILGVHKFIEGKIGMGLLYFCTGGLFAVGWFIDIGKYFMKAIKS